jgi:hypothetical protein
LIRLLRQVCCDVGIAKLWQVVLKSFEIALSILRFVVLKMKAKALCEPEEDEKGRH